MDSDGRSIARALASLLLAGGLATGGLLTGCDDPPPRPAAVSESPEPAAAAPLPSSEPRSTAATSTPSPKPVLDPRQSEQRVSELVRDALSAGLRKDDAGFESAIRDLRVHGELAVERIRLYQQGVHNAETQRLLRQLLERVEAG